MKKILYILLVSTIVFWGFYSYAQEVISELDDQGKVVLNEELRRLRERARILEDASVDGALGLEAGGTGQDLSTQEFGAIYYDNTTNGFTRLSPSTSGYVLSTQGAGAAPQWTSDTSFYNSQVFSSTGADTWTAPSGVNVVWLTVLGAGGGGGGGLTGSEYEGGSGGGGGASIVDLAIRVTAGNTYNLTVGAGGAGGAAGDNDGGDGGDSTFTGDTNPFDSAITAGGGDGGDGGAPGGGGSGVGGAGGTDNITPDADYDGIERYGGSGVTATGAFVDGGAGGSGANIGAGGGGGGSFFADGGDSLSGGVAGEDGEAGSGGAGQWSASGSATGGGGAGGDGFIIIRW
ncbi:MAG: hypothetical protein U9O94_01360 [Nanoarchaeota archaeon]|nr:hypothetical protein [Nanoarchaeota archaeon]